MWEGGVEGRARGGGEERQAKFEGKVPSRSSAQCAATAMATATRGRPPCEGVGATRGVCLLMFLLVQN